MSKSQQTPVKCQKDSETLRARLAELEQVYGSAPAGLCYLDSDLRCVFVNKRFAALSGLSVKEHLGRTISEVLPYIAAESEAQLRRVLETGEPITEGVVEAETRAQPGVKAYFEHHFNAVRSTNGAIVGVSCVVQNISKRIKAEKALRLIEEGTSGAFGEDFFRCLTRHLALALGVRCAFVSELQAGSGKRLRLLAYWQGSDFGEDFEYDTTGMPCEMVIEKGLTHYPANVKQLFPADRWLEESGIESYLAVPLVDSEGNRLGHLGVADDKPMLKNPLAELILHIFAARAGAELLRKRSEEALRDRTERYELIAAGACDAIWDWDVPNQRVYLSPRWKEMHGFDPDEVSDNEDEWVSSLHPEDAPRVLAAVQAHFEGKTEFFEEEYRIRCKDGSIKRVFDRGLARHDVAGNVVRMAGSESDITERKKVEDALRLTQFAVEHNSDATYWLKSDGQISYVNHAACKALGYSFEELVSLRIPDIDPDFPEDIFRARFLKIKEDGSMTFETHHRTKSGRKFPVEILSVYMAYGGKEYICAYARDITQRKQAEEVLRESELKYRELFETASDVICLIDAEGKITDINRCGEHLTGYSHAELCQMSVLDQLVVPEDRGICKQVIERAAPDAKQVYEVRWRTKQGKIVLLAGTSTYRYSASGELLTTRCTLRDITESRLAKEALRSNERQLRLITDNVQGLIAYVDSSLCYQFVNMRYAEVVGLTQEEISGRHISDILGQQAYDTIREHLECALAGKHVEFEAKLPLKFGKDLWFRTTYVPNFAGQRTVQGIYALTHDITERKYAEEQARQLQIDLAHITRLSTMGEMASGLAHELNQPLTVITNYANGCIRRLITESITHDELKEMLERIAAQAKRGGSIIRGLESLVRKGGVKRAPIDINESILEILDLTKVDAKQHKATTLIELQPNLPFVLADPIQVQQVILNLVQNACEACEKVPVSKRIVTIQTALSGEEELEITVSDSGAGISKELGKTLFEPFITSKSKGIGMGLAISKSIIESHNGKIWSTENPESGARFHFTLPIAKKGKNNGK